MRVRELMTQHVLSVRPGTPVHEIARLMHEHAISGMPVLDENDSVIGLVTELDLIVRNGRLQMPAFLQIFDATIQLETQAHLEERLRHMLGTRAEDVMHRDPLVVGPEMPVEELVERMVHDRANPV